jgi:hypothetical protein
MSAKALQLKGCSIAVLRVQHHVQHRRLHP